MQQQQQQQQQQQPAANNGNSPQNHDPGMAQMAMLFRLFRSGFMAGAAGMGDQARQFWEQAMNPQAGRTAKPASEAAVKRMPVRKLIDDKDSLLHEHQQCAVCQDAYCKGDEVIELPCGHCYHKDCAMPWLKENNTCPLCRKSVDAPEQKETDLKQQHQHHRHHQHHQHQQQQHHQHQHQQQHSSSNTTSSSTNTTNPMRPRQTVASILSTLPVRVLKTLMERHAVAHNDCIEKAELVERIVRRVSAPDIAAFLAAGPEATKQ